MKNLEIRTKPKMLAQGHGAFMESEKQEAAEGQEVFFHKGIIGFGDNQRYVFASFPKVEYWPLKILIHQQNPLLYFLIVEDQILGSDYTCHDVGPLYSTFGYKKGTTRCYFIVTVQGEGNSLLFSVNKRAPLLIDHEGRRGGQHILADKDLPLSCELSEFSSTLCARVKAFSGLKASTL